MGISLAGAFLGAAGMGFAGGLMNSSAQRDANKRNAKMQYDFAQQGIQWRVNDAIKAGVHPYYAMGASTSSPSIPIQSDNPGQALTNMAGTFNQYANIVSNAPTGMEQQMEVMNHELMGLQLQEARKAGKAPPLFIQAYDSNPNSQTFGKKVWIYNPDLEMEGLIPVLGTAYSTLDEAVNELAKFKQNLENQGRKHLGGTIKPSPQLQKQIEAGKKFLQDIGRRFSIPDFIKKHWSK